MMKNEKEKDDKTPPVSAIWNQVNTLMGKIRLHAHATLYSPLGHTHSGLFVPISPFVMVDTGGTSWDGAYAAAVGTHYFNLQDANHNLPAGISAVAVELAAKWAAANAASWCTVRDKGGAAYPLQVRAQVASIYSDNQGVVPVGTDDDIEAVVNNANAQGVYLVLVGYYT